MHYGINILSIELFLVNPNYRGMLFISDTAKAQVEKLKMKDEMPSEFFVRIAVEGGGCSGLSYKMSFDYESKLNDQIFEDKGIKLVTDLKSLLYLFNTTLEFTGGIEGKGFHFTNPNASRECACGESFAV